MLKCSSSRTSVSNTSLPDPVNFEEVPVIPQATPLEQLPGFDLESGRTWIYPTNYPVRKYQFDIVQSCLFQNTLVIFFLLLAITKFLRIQWKCNTPTLCADLQLGRIQIKWGSEIQLFKMRLVSKIILIRFFPFKEHWNTIFNSYTDLEKKVISSEEKISNRYCFLKNVN